MVDHEEENIAIHADGGDDPVDEQGGFIKFVQSMINWFKMLANEMHWSFIFGVLVINGISQGLGGALGRVGVEYYMKDIQKVQPSQAQIYGVITSTPWLVKPLWGLFTDFLPIVGVASMLLLSLRKNLHIVFIMVSLTAGSAGVAIADVTMDACVVQNSHIHPALAADLQSLCTLSSSIGAIIGFYFSGNFVHLIGPKGVIGLLTIPAGHVFLVGVLFREPHVPNFAYREVIRKFVDASKTMRKTLKYPNVWRSCLYMYLSVALSFSLHDGLFYWSTDPKAGPAFSQEAVGSIFSFGSIGSLLGAILYQTCLRDHPFRDLVFWTQLLYGLSGMLDLMLVLRINLQLGIPDYFFIVVDESVSQLIGRLKRMPFLVLSSKLCPPGIEGTFFALLMAIDHFGVLSSSWAGGALLLILKVTRTNFDNLWLAILIRNLLRLSPLMLLFLIPRSDQDGENINKNVNIELRPLVRNDDSR